MKRFFTRSKLFVIAICVLIFVLTAAGISYKRYVITRTNGYIRFVEWVMGERDILKFHKRVSFPDTTGYIIKDQPYWILSRERIQVEEIIKRTPAELVLIIKWGDSEKAYVSIKNWLTRKHDRIVIYPLDLKRRIAIYE